jgi:hypothetical protein
MFGDHSYDVGDLVQLVHGGKVWTETWLSKLKVRGGAGIMSRVNVYRLDNSFWDCYHEELMRFGW